MDNNSSADNNIFSTRCACWHVRRASRMLSQMYDDCLRPAGIRSSQYGMLRCIEGLPGACISELGRILDMDQTTATRNINKLEKAKLVKTATHKNDPRKKIVLLSDQGKSILKKAQPLWEKAQNRIEENMGAEPYNNFLQIMKCFSDAVKE